MDLKYNLAQTWLLRDRSPLPVTTLEVIKDFPEFVTVASSKHLECYIFFLISFSHARKGGMSARCVLLYVFDSLRKKCFLLNEKSIIPSALDK